MCATGSRRWRRSSITSETSRRDPRAAIENESGARKAPLFFSENVRSDYWRATTAFTAASTVAVLTLVTLGGMK